MVTTWIDWMVRVRVRVARPPTHKTQRIILLASLIIYVFIYFFLW